MFATLHQIVDLKGINCLVL